jgi:hypothetical protein
VSPARQRLITDFRGKRNGVAVRAPGDPRTYGRQVSTPPPIHTLGALRASGHVHRGVKAEIRENLLARLAAGEPSLPGIVGFDETVVPEVERALLAGHDMVLLGERGQGKTRLIRTLAGLLDEWTPVMAGSELNEHPYAPITVWGHRVVAERGDDTPDGLGRRGRRGSVGRCLRRRRLLVGRPRAGGHRLLGHGGGGVRSSVSG